MWPRRGHVPHGSTAAAVASSPSKLSTSFSFKDVSSLLLEDSPSDVTGDLVATPRRSSVFHRVRASSSALRAWRSLLSPSISSATAAAAVDNKIVLYYTSLRVVRQTFEDCRSVRSILRGFGVAVDERDLSMDSSFLAELKSLLAQSQLSLPRVFVGGRYLGGADEIRQLHESGELKRIISGAPPAVPSACDVCDGARFVLCGDCSGRHKRFLEKGGFKICNACNENGLLRCPHCCSSAA